jgi:MFS family permease
MLSLNVLIYGLFGPLAGSLGDRWKPKTVMITGVILLGLTTAGCGLAHELWHFYVLFGILMPIGTAFSGWPLLAPALTNWFATKRGLVIGLGQMGGGVSFAYAMFAEFMISQVGWRAAYGVLAGILVALLLPMYRYLFDYRPEDRGLKAYGAAKEPAPEVLTAAERIAGKSPALDWTLGRAMTTYRLWLLLLSQFLFWGIGNYLVLAHQVKFAEDVGYSSMFGATVFALFGAFMVAGQLSAALSDVLGREKTVTLAAILNIFAVAAIVCVADTSRPWLLYFYAICFGYGAGLYSPTIFAAAADIFYGRHFGAIAGLMLTGLGFGGAIGPWLGGYLYDVLGSYRAAFIVSMGAFGMASAAVWVAAPRNAARLRAKD